MNKQQDTTHLIKALNLLIRLVLVLCLVIVLLLALLLYYMPAQEENPDRIPVVQYAAAAPSPENNSGYWQAPDTAHLPAAVKEQALYGKELITHTALYYGPNGKRSKGAYNGMNCQNCHLDAGTKTFGNNYGAVASSYPRYRGRSGTTETIQKRVNDCFERSLNGPPLDTGSKEMKAILAWITWLGSNIGKDPNPPGTGMKDLAYLGRAADPGKGKRVYVLHCQSCHEAKGEGVWNADRGEYSYPPLWGNNSYNTGAGMYRLGNFAKFVKYNMPDGTRHGAPLLSDEEAWDVAAFVNSQPRPQKDLHKDWPKTAEKPFDYPFGPYADSYSELQHKYGPFTPIIHTHTSPNHEKKYRKRN